ncbi:MAG: AAA family ATPase [Methylotenera sp.]
MYYPHFGLKEPPFKITPNTDFFFSGGNRGAVLDALVYAITNGEGIIKVVGEVGSGKTMLCRMLQTILPEKIESIYLANPSVAPEDVLHAIAFELQLKLPKNADRLKVMQELQAHLLNRHAEGRQVVIFVEEAQGMPLATLEEIRLLSNLETKQDKLLQIVLFGQPELDVNLNQAHIRQLRERITHSFHLGPLQTKDVGEYLIFRLRAAGYFGPHLFTDAAIKKLSGAAEGLVRRVNILADKCLLAAFADNVHQVTPKHVKAAIQDSEFGVKPANYRRYFLWAIVLAGLLAVALTYAWWQSEHQLKRAPMLQESKLNSTKLAKGITNKLPETSQVETAKASINTNAVSTTNIQPDVRQLLVEKRFEASKSWLGNGSPTNITLQVKSLPSKNPLKDDLLMSELDRLGQQVELDNIYLYRKKQNGMLYTVILYGSYTERAEALSALRNLPALIKNDRPYLRTLAGINKDIEQTQ